jgi:DNA-binding transcriptional LysR family regulator
MDRLEAMSLLVDVVDQGGFSAAARVRRMPVTTVSRKISDLEQRIGAKLLVRTTRQVTLTDTGTDFVVAARRILAEVDEAESAAAGEFTAPKGELVITAPIFFGKLHVLPIVEEFLKLYSEINVRLVLLDRNVQLVESHVDMAVRIGALPDSSMIATKVGELRMMVCASRELLDRYGTPQIPADLWNMPCVRFDGPMPVPAWRFRDPKSKAVIEVPIKSRLSVTTAEAAVQAAVNHIGATRLLEYQLSAALAASALKPVLEQYEPAAVPVHLLHAERGELPLKMRLFLDLAVPRLRAVLPRN